MNRELLDRYCERGILGLVLAILLFGPLALGAVRPLEFSIIEGLTVAVALLWVLRLWLNPKPQILWPPICWAVLAFTAYAIARYLTADIEYIARQELLQVLVYSLLFFAILNNLHRQETTTILCFSAIFLALAISAYAIYQFLKNSDYVWHFIKPYAHRGSGTYICPNHLAGFLEMLLPLALAYTLTGRLKPVTRVLLAYAALVMLAGIGVTLSRGGWIATVVATGVLLGALLFRRQYRLPALALIGCMVLAGVIGYTRSFYIQERLARLRSVQTRVHDDMRFTLWRPAYEMWRQNVWWGVGPAHFDARFGGFRPEGVQMSPDRVHNDYLNTLTDWGIVGATLVAAAWVLLGVGLLQTWRSRRLASIDLGGKSTSNKYAFVLGASLGLLAILVHSFVDFNMHIPANAILAVTLMALLSGHLRFATERYWFRPQTLTRSLLTLLLLGAIVYVAPQGYRSAVEFVWLDRADHSPLSSVQQIAMLKRAFAVQPMNPKTSYALGEAYRRRSQEGGEYYQDQADTDYRRLANEAMQWFQKAMVLNPYDARSKAGYGWCLDWLDRPAEASAFFRQAERLDPNNYYNLNAIGLHYVSQGQWAAAKPWFERSARLEWQNNDIAVSYTALMDARLLEAATNRVFLGPR